MLFGSSVAGGGDIDGDGFSDVLVGAPGHSPNLAEQGSFNILLGNEGTGVNRLTRQYQSNLIAPLASNSMDFSDPNNFGIGHRAVNVTHRSDGRLHWEIAFEGDAWNGNPITNGVVATDTSAVWTDLGLNGVEIRERIFKKPGQIRYKWRVRVEFELSKAIDGQRFSRWFYGFSSGRSDIGVLPVDLLSFTGIAAEDRNVLNWVSALEHDLAYYEIQRANDPIDFYPIGSVNAVGSLNTLNYTFDDVSPLNGIGFYRLRMVDIDGTSEYAPIIAVRRSTVAGTLYPNPTNGLIQLDADISNAAYLTVIDAAGREISKKTLKSKAPNQFDVSFIPPGWYILQITDREDNMIYRGSFTKN